LAATKNYIYSTTNLNDPHVVVVAIGTTQYHAEYLFNQTISDDMDLRVFAIESYDAINTTRNSAVTNRINNINSYVCALIPQCTFFKFMDMLDLNPTKKIFC
jgi:hypothetical protein